MALGAQLSRTHSPTTQPATNGIARSMFLVSRNIDMACVLGGGVLLSLAFYVLWSADIGFLIAAAIFATLADFPHVLQSSVRVWMDPRERARHGLHYIVSITICGFCVSSLAFTGHLAILLTIWIGWQFLHVVKQHFGMLAIYAVKGGYRGGRKLIKYTLFTGCFAPFLYRLHEGMAFSDYVVFGNRLPFSGLAVLHPPFPGWIVLTTYCLFAAFLAATVLEQRRHRLSGSKILPWPSQITVAIAVISYNVSYIFVTDLYALVLIATTVHSLQYHLISVVRNRGRFQRQPCTGDNRLLLGHLVTRRSLTLYFSVLFVAGALVAKSELIVLGIIPLTIVLHHFYMDGFLWKGNLNPDLALHLGLLEVKSTSLASSGTSTGPLRPTPSP